MKRNWLVMLLCVALCLAMAFSFAACGDTADVPANGNGDTNNGANNNNDNNGNDNTNPGTTPDEPVIEKVTVTFKNGATVIDTVEINKGTAVAETTKTVEAPEGKQFKSWQKGGADYDFATKVNENITLEATFEDIPAPKFTITFKASADAADNLTEFEVEKDDYIQEENVPQAPDRSADHLTFVKWVRADDKTFVLDFESEVIEDITFIPVYKTTTYTVTLTEANGVTTWADQTIEYGGAIATPELPQGYVIDTVKNGTEDFNLATPVTSDLALTITLKALNHNVTFVDADGNEIAKVTVPDRGNAALPAVPSGSYWTATATEYAKMFNVTADCTVTLGKTAAAAYKTDKQWVNYAQAGDAINGADNRYTIDVTTGGWKLAQPPFQDVGAYFIATGNFAKFSAQFWVDKGSVGEYNVYVDDILVKVYKIEAAEAAVQGKTFSILDETILTAGMHTIKLEVVQDGAQLQVLQFDLAQPVKDEYRVTFKSDGTVFDTKYVASGATVTAPETTPTKEGYIFKGWNLDKNAFDFGTAIEKDYTLTAVFEEDLSTYAKVDFMADGKAYGKTVYVKKGTAVTAPAENPTKENYKFKHWSLTEDGEAFDFTTAITDDTTIYACFELDAVLHTVTYKDAEGNVLGTATVIDGQTAKLPAAPEGYYWTCTMTDLANITADKDVVLGKVDAALYPVVPANKWQITVNKTPEEQKTKYSVVRSGGNDQSWGYVFYKVGSYVEFKADIAGELRFGGNCDKKGQHFVLGLSIDGVQYETIEINTPQSFNISIKNLPAGEHTYRITILSATVDEGGENPGSWAGITWTVIGFQEKATPADEE